jgi:hypothetical protein
MILEHLQDPLVIGSPAIYVHTPSPIVLGVGGVLRSLTSNVSWPEQVTPVIGPPIIYIHAPSSIVLGMGVC